MESSPTRISKTVFSTFGHSRNNAFRPRVWYDSTYDLEFVLYFFYIVASPSRIAVDREFFF